jgi:membrane-bound serine protease (ClpP class)
MLQYLERGLSVAARDRAEVLVLVLDTPGGQLDLMDKMIQAMRASQTPVVVYVAPRGARAASAGALITMAGHAAAMAPETTIGAASPVGSEGEDLGETMAAKVKETTKATARTLVERRGPQALALAEAMIDEARAASVTEAYEVGLVDFIAADVTDLLQQLDGFTVQLAERSVTLHTAGARQVNLPVTLIENLLNILTNPNIVFLLITVGVQAILIEISSPGGWVAGFIGVVCLALATYGLGVLPVNWFGLVFLITAFVLFILDIKATAHGALTVAGVASLIVGALVLFNSPSTPSFQRVSVPLVVVTAIVTAAVFFTLVTLGLRAQKAPIRTGQEGVLAKTGVARSPILPPGSGAAGTVQLGGELWSAELAEGEAPIPAGSRVAVVRVEGIRLIVRAL